METLDQVARHYRRIAPAYALLSRLRVWPPGFRRRVIRSLALREGHRVLDLGCGTGANVSLIQNEVGPRGFVVELDYSPEMLRLARVHGRPRNGRGRAANVVLVRGDAATLPLAEQFDAALFCLSFFVMPEPFRALEAAWGLLRPGGRVVVADGKIPVPAGSSPPAGALQRVLSRTRLAPLLRTQSLPALRAWLRARGAKPEWREWFGGIFFLCRAVKP